MAYTKLHKRIQKPVTRFCAEIESSTKKYRNPKRKAEQKKEKRFWKITTSIKNDKRVTIRNRTTTTKNPSFSFLDAINFRSLVTNEKVCFAWALGIFNGFIVTPKWIKQWKKNSKNLSKFLLFRLICSGRYAFEANFRLERIWKAVGRARKKKRRLTNLNQIFVCWKIVVYSERVFTSNH